MASSQADLNLLDHYSPAGYKLLLLLNLPPKGLSELNSSPTLNNTNGERQFSVAKRKKKDGSLKLRRYLGWLN